jgi:uncharacterized membrane protein
MSQSNLLLTKLKNAGLVQNNDADDIQSQPLTSPWYIKTLLAISGWVGAVFFLGFVGLLMADLFNDLFDEQVIVGIVGGLLIVVAYFIIRIPKNEFFEHVGLAVSLAGQALVVFSIVGGRDPDSWLIVGVFHALLAVIMPNFVHRVFSSAFAAISFEVGFQVIGIPYVVSSVILILLVILYTSEFKTTKSYQKVSGLVYGLTLFWLTIHCVTELDLWLFTVLSSDVEPLFNFPYSVSQGLFVFAIMFSVWKVIPCMEKTSQRRLPNKATKVTKATVIALGGALLFCLLTIKSTGFSAAVVIIILGFSRSNRVLMGIGIFALLGFCSVYYYSMEQTLLYKSGVLLVVAIVMLTARFVIVRFWQLIEDDAVEERYAEEDAVEKDAVKINTVEGV